MRSLPFSLTLLLVSGLAGLSTVASAITPAVTVTSPANGSQDGSPVYFTASASSPDCSSGIAAMRIYTAPSQSAYTTDSDKLDLNLTLAAGTYNAVVQAWEPDQLSGPVFFWHSEFDDSATEFSENWTPDDCVRGYASCGGRWE